MEHLRSSDQYFVPYTPIQDQWGDFQKGLDVNGSDEVVFYESLAGHPDGKVEILKSKVAYFRRSGEAKPEHFLTVRHDVILLFSY